jgi:hypothetical protein
MDLAFKVDFAKKFSHLHRSKGNVPNFQQRKRLVTLLVTLATRGRDHTTAFNDPGPHATIETIRLHRYPVGSEFA